MSNIGKQEIQIPKNLEIFFKNDYLILKGTLGIVLYKLSQNINYKILNKDKIILKCSNLKGWGTASAHFKNLIEGITYGFKKQLNLVGVGLRAQILNKTLLLKLGFSHDIKFIVPESILIKCPKPNQIIIFGTNKELVYKTTALIKSLKTPDVYKGKGILEEGKHLILKEGKKN